MIRFIITALFVVLFLLVSIPLILVEWILGKFSQKKKDKVARAVVQFAFRAILFLSGTKLRVVGEENVPKDQAVLYIANHRSFYDIITTYTRVPGPTGFISKKEMEKFPVFRKWMKYIRCLFLDRADVKQGLKTILSAIDLIKEGISVFVFPEGTRNKTADTFLPFHEGSFKVATKTGCPIIPVTLYNTAAIFEDHLPKIRKTNITIVYGTPILPGELEKEELKHIGAYTQSIIEETYRKVADKEL